MKKLILPILALSIAAFAPASSHQCRELREDVLQPVKNVLSYLKMGPDLEALSGPGCLYIFQQLKKIPAGAEMIRQLGTQKAENVSSRCLYQVNSIHYSCTENTTTDATGESRCLPQNYSYCGQWEYSMTNENKYESAMELSVKLDTAYDKAQRLCGAALRWDEVTTPAALNELQRHLENEVTPRSEKIYEMACGG